MRSQSPAVNRVLQAGSSSARVGARDETAPVRPCPTLADARIGGTGILFAGYLVLLSDTYVGISRQFPFLNAAHIPTLLAWSLFAALLAKVGFRLFGEFWQNRLQTALVVFTATTILYAYVQTYAYEAFRAQFDNLILFSTTLYLLDRPSRFKALAITAAGLITALVIRNLDVLGAAGRQSGFKGGYFMTDGNDFAWGLIVLMPIALFLLIHKHRLPLRVLGAVAGMAVLVGVVGTQSRGGTLAVAAAGLFYLVFLAKRKMLGIALMVIAVAIALATAPAEYVGRIESVSHYEEDNSARGRLQAWGVAIRMAADHPLGVGADNFNTAYGRIYLPRQQMSTLTWGQNRWLSPHSIYFRALGEYGVPGLILVLSIIATGLLDVRRARSVLAAGSDPVHLPVVLPSLAAMGLIGCAVAGIFLGGLTYPHLYILCGLAASLNRLTWPAAVMQPESAGARAERPNAPSQLTAVVRRPGLRAAASQREMERPTLDGATKVENARGSRSFGQLNPSWRPRHARGDR
jgi:probable O-glycosylation ligase (exosortase A-associated)